MKIQFLQEELLKLNISSNIKASNELYIEISAGDVTGIISSLLTKFKLTFIAEFCRQENGFIINILLSNRSKGYYVIAYYKTLENLISLQEIIFQAHLFEREISDLYGLKIISGKDVRNIVKHEIWQNNVYPLRKSFKFGSKIEELDETPKYEFKKTSGEGGYQIAVGPVHAGIMEPGHFRFSVIGEEIENLEIRLMYKHKGIEKMCENVDANKLNLLFKRVAGESSVAYGEAYALLVEELINYDVSTDIKYLRVVFLELERIYNYLEDISGICVDIGFSYPAKKYSYLSELIHQLCERLTGSRFLRNTIVPCGINKDYNKQNSMDVISTLDKIKIRFDEITSTTLNSVAFLDRVENTGMVKNSKAKRLNLTGIVGRASGVIYDVRTNFGYEMYKSLKTSLNYDVTGGIFARYNLKISEINDAILFINQAINAIEVDFKKSKPDIKLKPNSEKFVSVETVKGELTIYGHTGEDNKFDRIYFKTPSFTNWNGLTFAILNEVVPDFPVCNKSFNMSYCENDR